MKARGIDVDAVPDGVELTLGVEEELHLVDRSSRRLSARASRVLSHLPAHAFTAEIQRTTVEFSTEVVTTLGGLRAQLLDRRRALIDAADLEGLAPAAVGTAPLSDFADFELTSSGRFARMQERYRMLVDEQLICGTQIHVGVSDRDLAVRIMQRIAPDLPIFCAMAASSPYLSGADTGYASIRSIIWQRWPSAGGTGHLENAAEYDAMLADLIGSGVIADEKMAYFDVRPSSHEPTIELRVLDACPIIDDAVLIAGLYRAAVRQAAREIAAGGSWEPPRPPLHRAAMWQAARSGLSGPLLDGGVRPKPVRAGTAVRALLDRLRPDLEALGDLQEVEHLVEALAARGNSADRQRAAFAERGRLEDVVDLVLAETAGPASGPALEAPALRRYRVRAGDEAIGPASRPRPVYRGLLDHYRELGSAGRRERLEDRDRRTNEAGLTFGVEGVSSPFVVDLLPRVITAHDWRAITAGISQRARAIEAFLQDVYTDGRILESGIVQESELARTGAWRPEGRALPAGVVRAPIMGFDLIRDELGGWRVLEDNVRSPSGMAFAMAARDIVDAVLPDAPRPASIADPRDALALLRRTLQHPLGDEARVCLLSAGSDSSAWYEHRRLADGAGLALRTPDDVRVVDGRVTDAEGTAFDVLYLRLDDELSALTAADGRAVGEEILAVAREGGVRLANAPGTGVADDKAMYVIVPELIRYYLDEHPLLEPVPTYRLSDPGERSAAFARLGELVTKPVDGQGGQGVLIGPAAAASVVAERRAALAANPDGWIAQETVRLSSHPTWSAGDLEPRRVDLRVFALLTGIGPDDVTVAPVGLTRMAAPGSMIVNSSAGGGAKDTWILIDEEER